MKRDGVLSGIYSDAYSAAQKKAELKIDQEAFTLRINQKEIVKGKRHKIKVETRIGSLPTKIHLGKAGIFTSKDHALIDLLFPENSKLKRFIQYFESRLAWSLCAAIFVFMASLGFVTWGIPHLSHTIAHILPEGANKVISFKLINILDNLILEESQLSPNNQQKIREHFYTQLVPLEPNNSLPYKLHFRKWNPEIANALALPAGDIILTDAFVNLCANQNEMDSVILHEMGHISHRHSLKALIRSTFITGLLVLISGDANLLVDSSIGIGALLNDLKNSRDHEIEADLYAFEKMISAGIDPIHFSNILVRLAQMQPTEADTSKKLSISQTSTATKSSDIGDYLSTHPSTIDRVNLANCYSQCFQEGYSSCKHSSALEK